MAAVTLKQAIWIAVAICAWSTLLYVFETYSQDGRTSKIIGALKAKALRSSDKLESQLGRM